jgi:hypothetical protein
MITPRCCGYAHGGTRTWATPGTDASTVTRFPGRDHFAAWNGTAPVEVLRRPEGLPAVAAREPAGQLRDPHRRGHPDPAQAQPRPRLLRAQDRRGQDPKEALRALKRRISDAIYARPLADARTAAASKDPGGQPGNDSGSSAAGFHPEHRLFGQATPGPQPRLRPAATPPGEDERRRPAIPAGPRDTERIRSVRPVGAWCSPAEAGRFGCSMRPRCWSRPVC